MKMFDQKVLSEIKRQQSHGARFPCPVGLMYMGELTEAAERLGLKDCDDRPVMEAVKRLHKAGEVKFVYRWGYTWVLPKGYPGIQSSELTDSPTDAPYYWDDL